MPVAAAVELLDPLRRDLGHGLVVEDQPRRLGVAGRNVSDGGGAARAAAGAGVSACCGWGAPLEECVHGAARDRSLASQAAGGSKLRPSPT